MKQSSRSQSSASARITSTSKAQEKFPAILQQELFDRPNSIVPGSLNDAGMIRASLVEAIRKSAKSREELAEIMTLLTGTEVTARRINAFTAESREDFRFPAELARAFCIATDDFSLLRNLIEAAGYYVVDQAEFEMLQLGREYLRQKRANERVESLEARLRGVEL
jgi:hypothetical protein